MKYAYLLALVALVVDDAGSGVTFHGEDVAGAVGGAVVDHDDLPVDLAQIHLAYPAEHLLDGVALVKHRDYYG